MTSTRRPKSSATLARALEGRSNFAYRAVVHPGADHGYPLPDRDVFDKHAANRDWEIIFAMFRRCLGSTGLGAIPRSWCRFIAWMKADGRRRVSLRRWKQATGDCGGESCASSRNTTFGIASLLIDFPTTPTPKPQAT